MSYIFHKTTFNDRIGSWDERNTDNGLNKIVEMKMTRPKTELISSSSWINYHCRQGRDRRMVRP